MRKMTIVRSHPPVRTLWEIAFPSFLKQSFKKFTLCGSLLLLLISIESYAQTSSLIKTAGTPIYSEALTSSDFLVTLKKGSRVDMVGVSEGGWSKVKVKVSGFEFEGWAQSKNIISSKKEVVPQQPAPQAPVFSTPPVAKQVAQPQLPMQVPQKLPATSSSNLTPTSPAQLEQFFEPAGKTSTPDPVSSETSDLARSLDDKRNHTSKRANEKTKRSPWISDKLVVFASPSYTIHQYSFSDATKDAFRYNIMGLGIIAGVEYKPFNFLDDLIRTSAVFQGQYSFLNTKTNLLDGDNTKFSDLTAKNRFMDLWLKLKVMFNFDRMIDKPFLIGLSGGYEYLKFSGDDVVDDTGVPVGLFISQTIKSVPVGIFSELHFLDPVVLILGTDVLLFNSISESPDGSSGSQPVAKMGYAPYFSMNFPLTGGHHMGLRYQLRIQEASYTGPSSSRVNNILNEASSLSLYHTLGLEYAYHF